MTPDQEKYLETIGFSKELNWVQRIIRLVKNEIPKEFVGQVELNVFKGGISNINIKQSIKGEDTTK